ncbi:MAG: hypothetical protein MSA07_03920 [Mucispirillum sp.]|nr:hypothetical protein [Mucispirillum sp.]
MKSSVNSNKYYKPYTGKILFFIFVFLFSTCLISEAKTYDYYFLNQAEAQKKVQECKKWEKDLSDKEKKTIMESLFSGNISKIPKKTINMLNECDNAEKAINAKNFVKSVKYYSTHLKDAMRYIKSCKNSKSLPVEVKEEYNNAVKAVKDGINGDIAVQSSDRIGLMFGTARTITEFEKKPEEAKELLKTCLNADGSLKSKEELEKIDYNRYDECLNADKAVNKNWIGSQELREKLIQFAKENQL